MTPRSKLYFALAGLGCLLAAVILASQPQPAAITSPLAIHKGNLRQDGQRVEFTVKTARPVDVASLDGLPGMEDGRSRYLCLELRSATGPRGARICAGPGDRAGITPLGPGAGKPAEVEAEFLHPAGDELTVRFSYGLLDLDPGRYRFRFVSSDGGCGSEPGNGCVDSIPDGDGAEFNLRVPALVACGTAGGREVRYGPRDRREVAITFDDGPGSSTADILEVLRRKRTVATFFLLGAMIKRDPEAVRQIPRQGSEVANHSTAHAARPPQSDIENANREIQSASGVEPCAFRPPYGAVDPTVVASAKAAGLDTVLWDVDTDDWQSWSTSEGILANVRENTQNGSIILMHDGGDRPRPKTVEVLPKIIDLLREEGFSLVTVSQLLGSDITWEPLGKP